MRTLLCLVVAVGFQVSQIHAKDLVTQAGVTYKDVKIVEVVPIGISFISHGKAGWVDFRDLPADTAREYGYDPKKAGEFEAQLVRNKGSAVSPTDTPDMKSVPLAATLDSQTVPQTPENTIEVDSGYQVVYDPVYFASAGPVYYNRWIHWHGSYYPYYWWHHWWWGHHWVYSHGRYYPWHYYHHHGLWHGGKYYPYHHGVLGHETCKEKGPHTAAHHESGESHHHKE